MGLRGPTPTPTAILKLRNSILVPRRRDEPQPELVDRLTCPDHLSPEAKQVWRQIAPQLVALGVLARTDANALAQYCRLFARWKEAEAFLDQHGMVYPIGVDGRMLSKGSDPRDIAGWKEYPQAARSARMVELLTAKEREFGLTPSARTRIQIKAEDKGSDALQEFIAKRHA